MSFRPGWRRRVRRLGSAPDPDLVDAGLRGEWLVAGIRLLIVIVLLYLPLIHYLAAPGEGRARVLWVGIAALAEALVVYSAVMRSWGRGWIGFFSGVLDVTLVTASLWMTLPLGDAERAIGDLVIFPVYFLAIGATSLRYDWRICALTGVAAMAEYLGLVHLTSATWDDEVSWPAQLGRLTLLGMATVLAVILVLRAVEQRSRSNHDRLTALANRGFFDDSLLRIGALAARTGEAVAVAMIDVDHFKRFNDTHGHLVGDEALRAVARILATTFRDTDLVARYGGEEFAGLFPGLSQQDAFRRLDRLRALIESTPVTVDSRGGTRRVTVSIGVAVWPADGTDLKQTLAIADQRLYQAKLAGRNRVVASGGDGSEDDGSEDDGLGRRRPAPAEAVNPGRRRTDPPREA